MRVIFLDIDGVIQPGNSAIRFTNFDIKKILAKTTWAFDENQVLILNEVKAQYDKETEIRGQHAMGGPSMNILKSYLTRMNPLFETLDLYDIAAVCCDWRQESVNLLKQLCNETSAKIVISSDWRYSKNLEQLKLLFGIHELADTVVDMISTAHKHDYRISRAMQIKEYITAHIEVKKFAIFDDLFKEDYDKMLPSKLVYHEYGRCFNLDRYNEAKSLLS